ncbi:E3 ubiquitin-protein ligase ZNRF1 isoform X2 [Tribolium castaneum]|uniref:E3 ubiquitin-protein ligase ZNRF1 n=1 Tax=Tribolium castaneum TaxID=7070 RepID=A0A139WLS8_TRICA|nr:PREDICTED: E3 ubiquitin-protein ligase znrf1 isoform X2 [Tribolium castaneum]KYB28900.1 E3 ubiquitin-protein ligase ZNRF2-like protein [Tribolium castaneum]|eukprot:XP_970631.1 PREDICTED: E3 ubiquitin-protein ligase znrf1 isoform X2 [Tribolium castaneum]
MGAKPSTANGAQSPRTRAFSTSSSSEVVTAPGFRFMRSLGMDMSSDRQRARSLSSVPDLHTSHETIAIPATGASFDVSTGASPETDSSSAEDTAGALASAASSIALGRVYAAHSLPSHIWSLNGIKCPVCSKFVIPDDIECHLVMCLTKPRLSYNEDILTDDKGECVICLEELSQGDVIARLPCLCIYHKMCIDQWFEVNRSCPEHPGD